MLCCITTLGRYTERATALGEALAYENFSKTDGSVDDGRRVFNGYYLLLDSISDDIMFDFNMLNFH